LLDNDRMRRRILILEDDAMLRKLLRRLFSARGWDVCDTGSVTAFLDAAAEAPFDACLFDLSLPDGDGLDAWNRARRSQPDARPVLMTAHGGRGVDERASALGVLTTLAKPFDIATVVAAVGA
jgi:two-component system KDP operon response regulator KdpE